MDQLENNVSPRTITLQVYSRYEERKVFARVRVVGEPHVAIGGKVELTLLQSRSGIIAGHRTIGFKDSFLTEEVEFDLTDLRYWTCRYEAVFIDRNGIPFTTRVLHEKLPDDLSWLGSKTGVSRKVPEPWIPLKMESNKNELSIKCWGREYQFDGKSFIRNIVSAGESILAHPVCITAQADGKDVDWNGDKVEIVSSDSDQIVISQEIKSPNSLIIKARTEIDFDGMLRIDWSISSNNSKPIQLEKLSMKIPILKSFAKYFYFYPSVGPYEKSAGALESKDKSMGFYPYIWIGDEERGLSWFAESNEYWFNSDSNKQIEIKHNNDDVTLWLRLVSNPVTIIPGEEANSAVKFIKSGEPDEPIRTDYYDKMLRYTFGIQATPVKPVTSDAWDYRTTIIQQQTLGFQPRLNVTDELLDTYQKAGVRTVVMFEHWADAEAYVKTPHGDLLKDIISRCHDRGFKVLLYFGFLISDIIPEWKEFGKDCLVLPKTRGYHIYHYPPQPEQAAWFVCLNSPWQDFLMDGIARALDEFDADGVYLDGTAEPWGCTNTEHGCGYLKPDKTNTPAYGWIKPNGYIAPTYPIFSVRSAMRRIYEIVRSRKPDSQINVHNSKLMTMPTVEWATSVWDGEQFQSAGRKDDIHDLLPLDLFRAEFMGRQWGVAPEFLLAGEAYTYKEACGISLLHDVPVRPFGIGEPGENLELMSKIWQLMDDFGRKEAEFLPYWGNSDYVNISSKGIYVSLYKHPNNGLLAFVVNLGKEQKKTDIALNVERLGIVKGQFCAIDALTKQEIVIQKDTISCNLESLEWKYIWIKRKQ